MPLSNGKIREEQYNDSRALCNAVNEILLHFHVFHSLWIRFSEKG
jgi:hypothetical protein